MSLPQPSFWDDSQSWVHPLQPILPPDSDGSFDSVHAQSWKRRAPRASLACDACREKKKACDEGRPCSSCDKTNIPCRYSSSKSTRRVVDVEDSMHQLANYTASLNAQIKDFKPILDSLAARVDAFEGKIAGASSICPTMRREIWNSRKQCHLSGAHNLISLWPTVHGALYTAGIPVGPTYVSIAEDKGAWHLKQGQKAFAKTPPSLSPYFEHAESRREGGLHNNNKRKATDLSHQLLDIESHVGNPQHMSQHKRLLQSYVENMHLLHPIVDLNYVESLLDQYFKDGPSNVDSPADANHQPDNGLSPGWGSKRQRLDNAGVEDSVKKLYRPAPVNIAALDTALVFFILALGEVCAYKRRSLPGRKMSVSTEGTASHNSFFSSTTISPTDTSITQPSPRMLNSTENSPMPASIECSRTNSLRAAPRTPEPAIPGMRFYERAAEIFGMHMDGNELIHAQIAILAGLYKGQIGQVRESMNWICMAGRIVQFLLHRYDFLIESRDAPFPEDPIESRTRMQRRMKGPEDDLILLAAWTCIQLESDILAELPFPPSGILAYENELSWPVRIPGAELYSKLLPQSATEVVNFSSHNVLMVYTAQLWLRKRLNSIQEQLHGHACAVLEPDQFRNLLLEHQHTLEQWRGTLPNELTWNNNDAPAHGILAARLRAKYWGACFLAYRPYLDYILHAVPEMGQADGVCTVALDSYRQVRQDAAARFFTAIATMSEAKVLEGATRCIEAAFQSTHAFDGVPHELIVTNLHGTAHAQFGNVLVLVAAYTGSASLKSIITHTRLTKLIKHTIMFLDRQSFLPHTCKIDRAILKRLLLSLAEVP